ncbi:chaplin [Streptomyces sp. NPDC001817]|uniref:chaplin n=1 Tax=Streptomyces sp. NPDC001817 TaxID=3154398 RepID=UPI003332F6BF
MQVRSVLTAAALAAVVTVGVAGTAAASSGAEGAAAGCCGAEGAAVNDPALYLCVNE